MEALSHYHHCPIYDDSGNELIRWIARSTGSCVYGTTSAFSWTFGLISLAAWLGAQVPQLATNYRNGSVEGLAPALVGTWFAGDFCNFAGCVLTGQLPFQTLLAFYYVCVDLVMCGQVYYYTRKQRFCMYGQCHKNGCKRGCKNTNKRLHKNSHTNGAFEAHQDPVESIFTRPMDVPGIFSHSALERDQDIHHRDLDSNYAKNYGQNVNQDLDQAALIRQEQRDTLGPLGSFGSFFKAPSSIGLKSLLTASFVASFSKVKAVPLNPYNPAPSSTTTTPQSIPTIQGISTFTSIESLNLETVGLVFAWTCTCCYLTSRAPQILSNWRRRSTAGTSVLLFLAALTGNATYTLSILLSPNARGPHGKEFLKTELPFLIGSAGTVLFDMILFGQWVMYSKNSDTVVEKVSDQEQGRDTKGKQILVSEQTPLSWNASRYT